MSCSLLCPLHGVGCEPLCTFREPDALKSMYECMDDSDRIAWIKALFASIQKLKTDLRAEHRRALLKENEKGQS